MRYMATIYVSDIMDDVALTAEVQGWFSQFGAPEMMCQRTLVWPGIGENDPLEWLARALFMAAEELTKPAPGRGARALPMGDPHTISGISAESI